MALIHSVGDQAEDSGDTGVDKAGANRGCVRGCPGNVEVEVQWFFVERGGH